MYVEAALVYKDRGRVQAASTRAVLHTDHKKNDPITVTGSYALPPVTNIIVPWLAQLPKDKHEKLQTMEDPSGDVSISKAMT